MPKNNKKSVITLETLLEVKRSERPDSEFWDSFESNFERRRLHALVERKSFLDYVWTPTVKAFAFSAPAVLLVGLAAFWVRSHEPVETRDLDGTIPAPFHISSGQSIASKDVDTLTPVVLSKDLEKRASSHFVVDAMQDDNRRHLNFRKVLYTPAIKLSIPSGASYVQDSMRSQNYRVTTAEMKPGRNF